MANELTRTITLTSCNRTISIPIFISICIFIYICICIYICSYGHNLQYIYMGWLRLVGSFKLYVCFAEYRLFYICIYIYICSYGHNLICLYGLATISRLLKIIGLFCKISSLLQGSFAKETYNFKEPTNRSHPISVSMVIYTPLCMYIVCACVCVSVCVRLCVCVRER